MKDQETGRADIGTKLPSIEFGPVSRTMLALYAGASGDHNPVHIDIDMAKRSGMPDVFAHGMLSFGMLSRVASGWAGIEHLRGFRARFVSMTQVHDIISCRGTIVERYDEDGETRFRIEMEARAQDGRVTLRGEAIVAVDA